MFEILIFEQDNGSYIISLKNDAFRRNAQEVVLNFLLCGYESCKNGIKQDFIVSGENLISILEYVYPDADSIEIIHLGDNVYHALEDGWFLSGYWDMSCGKPYVDKGDIYLPPFLNRQGYFDEIRKVSKTKRGHSIRIVGKA